MIMISVALCRSLMCSYNCDSLIIVTRNLTLILFGFLWLLMSLRVGAGCVFVGLVIMLFYLITGVNSFFEWKD
jgi:hypothetical protein